MRVISRSKSILVPLLKFPAVFNHAHAAGRAMRNPNNRHHQFDCDLRLSQDTL